MIITKSGRQKPFPNKPISKWLLRRKPTPGPQFSTEEVEGVDTEDTAAGQAGQQADTGADTQVDEERSGKMDSSSGKGWPREVVTGEKRGAVLRVGQRQI